MITMRLAVLLGAALLGLGLLVGGAIVYVVGRSGPPAESATGPRHEGDVDYCTDIVAVWANESFAQYASEGDHVSPEELGRANDLGDGIGEAITRAANGVETDLSGVDVEDVSFSVDEIRADCRR